MTLELTLVDKVCEKGDKDCGGTPTYIQTEEVFIYIRHTYD